MKLELTKKLLAIATIVSIGLFSQFSLAQDDTDLKTIAGIVAGMNHFPSDADKATLMGIAENSERQGVQMIATAVGNIAHGADAEGKAAMGQIIAFDGAPANVKALAEVVQGFMHMASDDAKAVLAGL